MKMVVRNNLLLSKVLLPLSQEINYEQRIEEELEKIKWIIWKKKIEGGLGECEQFVIAKKYNSIEDLKRDNGKEEFIYDREYDNTRYDIMEEFEADREILKTRSITAKNNKSFNKCGWCGMKNKH